MEKSKVLNMVDPPDGLKDKLVNAVIIAGFTFFSTLAGQTGTGDISNMPRALITAGIAAGVSFFASLMTQLGLKKPEVE